MRWSGHVRSGQLFGPGPNSPFYSTWPRQGRSSARAALCGDLGNNELLGRTFPAVLANCEVEEGVKLAKRVLQVDKNDLIARLVLGVLMRSGMVLYCSRQVAIIQRFSLVCPGHKPVCVPKIGLCSIEMKAARGIAMTL
jgi:hypothetical protein